MIERDCTEETPPVLGVFDSGIGGLTVVREIRRLLPAIPMVYFGDTARTPYGTKSTETLRRYAEEDSEFLLSHGANVLVIACHSAASVARDHVAGRFPVQVFDVVGPAIETAVRVTRNGKIGLIGTRATVESGVYQETIARLDPSIEVVPQPCPLLVPLVEEGWLRRRETRMIVRKYLRPLKEKGVDTLVLGCTHYPLLKGVISEKMGKRVTIVDPSEAVALRVKEYLEREGKRPGTGPAKELFFLSDIAPVTGEIARRFMGRRIEFLPAEPGRANPGPSPS